MDNTKQILKILADRYPNPSTALHYQSSFQLLIATILSAQCTDQRVNKITAKLFAKYPTCAQLATLSPSQIGDYIRSAGLWRNKAKNIHATCQILLDRYHGEVPKTREDLEALPGVGRKTANVLLANAFNIPAIAVDTHVQRVANRLGLASAKNPRQTEDQLMAKIPQNKWSDAHHWLIYHGRETCKAQNPLCHQCPLATLCKESRV